LRVLVCGDRHWTQRNSVFNQLSYLHKTLGVDIVIEGGCSGADLMARAWAEKHGVAFEQYDADWEGWAAKGNRYAAGPIRN
jgi:hypothetical protein